MILAVTGGTGFVGSHLLDRAVAEGHQLRALTRRPQPSRPGVDWIAGALDDRDALAELVRGAEAVIHVAGAVNAPDREGFIAANVSGTRAVIAAAEAAGVRRFVQVSSLAAREPALSAYGWSKAEADRLLRASGLDWTIVRPPAIFGPRDHEMLELFRCAARGLVPLPPAGGRLSVLYVSDLVALLLALATSHAALRQVIEPDDGTAQGWDHRDFARAIGTALGTKARPFPLPRPVLSVASALGRLTGGPLAKLTPDRVRYFAHPDWVSHARPPAELWASATPTPAALRTTAQWYRAEGLL